MREASGIFGDGGTLHTRVDVNFAMVMIVRTGAVIYDNRFAGRLFDLQVRSGGVEARREQKHRRGRRAWTSSTSPSFLISTCSPWTCARRVKAFVGQAKRDAEACFDGVDVALLRDRDQRALDGLEDFEDEVALVVVYLDAGVVLRNCVGR